MYGSPPTYFLPDSAPVPRMAQFSAPEVPIADRARGRARWRAVRARPQP
jgi:hypothetical protein